MSDEFGPFPSPIDRLIVQSNNISLERDMFTCQQYTVSKAYSKTTGDRLIVLQPARKSFLSKPNNYTNFIIKCTKLTCPFLLPIVSYTDEEPLMIISDYLKQGSLRDNLKTRNNLSGAQKTIIAISIANAMLYCHHRNVFMPSLTPDIIYITPRGNAKISVIEMFQRPLPPWSAPEIRSINDATTKSDVFLLGFILYELFTGDSPFGNMSDDEIRQNIKDKKRPSVSRLEPQNLSHLIQKCWSHQSENRPTIEEIVRTLESGDVVFPNTDMNEVDYFISKLENRRRKKNMMKTSPTKNQPNAYLHVFMDYNNPTFFSDLVRIEDILDTEDHYQFYYICANHFKAGTPIKVVIAVLEAIRVVLENTIDYTAFNRSNILKLLPYDDEQFDREIFDILNCVFCNSPKSITTDQARVLELLIKRNPSKTIILFAYYCKHLEQISDPWPIIQILIDNVKLFYHSRSGAEYVSTLFFLCFNYQNFYKKNDDIIRQIFCTFLHSEDAGAAKAAYRAVFTLLDPKYQLPFPQIISDVGDTDLSECAISLLLKITNFPVNKLLIDTLLMLSGVRPDAYLLLLRCADTMDGSSILSMDTNWMSSGALTDAECLKLLMVTLKNLQVRKQITSSPLLPNLLNSVLKNDDSQVLICIAKTMQCLNVTRDFLNVLAENSFFKKLLSTIKICSDDIVKSFLIDVISIVSKESYNQEFLTFIDPLMEYLKGSERLMKSSFSALVYLSFHDECAKKMKEKNISDALKKLPSTVIPSDQVQTIISNIQ
ncbi:TKL family protein kinase [Trichomonas vaginalis G3]|uniref:TKL family protein kinase n=1 Tax=Trichomonas vaginalis (strain ATCC PRA-98 / G3) TaxID=412133 RepID=A2FZ01_TRIV3|nr:protein kinase protein [Trichomonas vaginalis G3]EAX89864.1 TKL family protein kinase [Trichomonas vaginalis G3]KAI5551872.1 protein kinase protein [Trichomonas vaginalis G3]|eukprot:XP_001302794.1 TKL family protein kinase [Trichomonas vaginalis G3]